MKPERLRELADIASEGRQASERGENAPRNLAFHLIGLAALLAVAGSILGVILGAELTGIGLGDHRFGPSPLKTVFGDWGPIVTAIVGIELVLASLATGALAGLSLAGAVMEHLWLGRVLRWSLVPAGALLLGSAVAGLGVWRAGVAAARLPMGPVGWLVAIAAPTVLFAASAAIYAPLFRREGE